MSLNPITENTACYFLNLLFWDSQSVVMQDQPFSLNVFVFISTFVMPLRTIKTTIMSTLLCIPACCHVCVFRVISLQWVLDKLP